MTRTSIIGAIIISVPMMLAACNRTDDLKRVGQETIHGQMIEIFAQEEILREFMNYSHSSEKDSFIEDVISGNAPNVAVYHGTESTIIKCPEQARGQYESYQLFHKLHDGKNRGALLVINWRSSIACFEEIPQNPIPL